MYVFIYMLMCLFVSDKLNKNWIISYISLTF